MESPDNPPEGEVLGGVEAFDEVFDASLLVPYLTAIGENWEYAGDVESTAVLREEAVCR